MYVIALVGPSGTGKSHRALLVAHEHNVDMLIDDGLLIKDHNILAGISAKRQNTAVGAIKTALFTDREHAGQVKSKLHELMPKKILVLGTSKGMVDRISERLGIPKPNLYLDINDVASPAEIKKALKIRQDFGKHVIPAPTVAVKPRLSGVLMEPLQVRFPKKHRAKQDSKLWVNQTVARPTFNFYGKFYISNLAMQEIIKGVLIDFEDILKTHYILIKNTDGGTIISVDLIVKYGKPFPPMLKKARRKVKEIIEYMTALHVLEINFYVRKIIIE